mmetsp:Transcript_3494/g.6768  ORF Transcript_3494/g.6768 Transcript_3494/m.6768 type:complete len:920 (-) Transcript_3494:129-2888(-)
MQSQRSSGKLSREPEIGMKRSKDGERRSVREFRKSQSRTSMGRVPYDELLDKLLQALYDKGIEKGEDLEVGEVLEDLSLDSLENNMLRLLSDASSQGYVDFGGDIDALDEKTSLKLLPAGENVVVTKRKSQSERSSSKNPVAFSKNSVQHKVCFSSYDSPKDTGKVGAKATASATPSLFRFLSAPAKPTISVGIPDSQTALEARAYQMELAKKQKAREEELFTKSSRWPRRSMMKKAAGETRRSIRGSLRNITGGRSAPRGMTSLVSASAVSSSVGATYMDAVEKRRAERRAQEEEEHRRAREEEIRLNKARAEREAALEEKRRLSMERRSLEARQSRARRSMVRHSILAGLNGNLQCDQVSEAQEEEDEENEEEENEEGDEVVEEEEDEGDEEVRRSVSRISRRTSQRSSRSALTASSRRSARDSTRSSTGRSARSSFRSSRSRGAHDGSDDLVSQVSEAEEIARQKAEQREDEFERLAELEVLERAREEKEAEEDQRQALDASENECSETEKSLSSDEDESSDGDLDEEERQAEEAEAARLAREEEELALIAAEEAEDLLADRERIISEQLDEIEALEGEEGNKRESTASRLFQKLSFRSRKKSILSQATKDNNETELLALELEAEDELLRLKEEEELARENAKRVERAAKRASRRSTGTSAISGFSTVFSSQSSERDAESSFYGHEDIVVSDSEEDDDDDIEFDPATDPEVQRARSIARRAKEDVERARAELESLRRATAVDVAPADDADTFDEEDDQDYPSRRKSRSIHLSSLHNLLQGEEFDDEPELNDVGSFQGARNSAGSRDETCSKRSSNSQGQGSTGRRSNKLSTVIVGAASVFRTFGSKSSTDGNEYGRASSRHSKSSKSSSNGSWMSSVPLLRKKTVKKTAKPGQSNDKERDSLDSNYFSRSSGSLGF